MLKKIITRKSEGGASNFDLSAVLAIITVAVFTGLIIFKIAPSMDEYLPYHQLACLVNNTQNLFREGCHQYDLVLFGKTLALRSYGYVGFSNSLFYLPFYLLWKSYLSARLLKLIFLILTAIFAIKISKVDWRIGLVIFCCFFPFAFQMIVDTGPIAFQCMTMVFVIWLCSRANYGVRESLLAGIVTFFAVEQKLFFAPFLLPVFIYCLIAYGGRETFGKIIKFFVPIAIIVFAGSLAILTAKTSQGISYSAEISGKFSGIPLTDFGSQWTHLAIFKPFIASFYNFTESVINAKSVWDFNTLFFYIALLFVGFIAMQLISINNSRQEVRGALAGISALLVSIWLMCLSKDSSSGHHLAIILPFFLLVVLNIYKVIQARNIKVAYLLALLFIIPNFLILARTVHLTPLPEDDWSRLELMKYTDNLAGDKNAFVMSDWGTYYLISLYTKKNTPVYFEDLSSGPLNQSINNLLAEDYSVYLVALQRPVNASYDFKEVDYNNIVNNWHLYKIYENFR